MALNMKMTVVEAGRTLARGLLDYATTIGTAVFVAAIALASFWSLRTHEDHLIERLLEAEGRVLASEMTRALDTRTYAVADLARRWESVAEPGREAWESDARALATADPVYRAFEWRDAGFTARWSTPLTARLPGAELDSIYEAARVGAMAGVLQHPAGIVSPSFPGPGGQRLIVFAAPLLGDGTRFGAIGAVARASDLIKAIVEPATRRGYSVAVREGPYHVFGPLASREGEDAELWQNTVAVRAGDLVWAVDYWPGGEVLDRLRSFGPPLVLLAGLFAAVIGAVMVRSLELARRVARATGGQSPTQAERIAGSPPDPGDVTTVSPPEG